MSEFIKEDLQRQWGGWIERIIPEGELTCFTDQIPSSWVNLVSKRFRSPMDDLWPQSGAFPPQFVDLINAEFEAAAVCLSQVGLLLNSLTLIVIQAAEGRVAPESARTGWGTRRAVLDGGRAKPFVDQLNNVAFSMRHCLVYQFARWGTNYTGELERGFMLAGLPLEERIQDDFVKKHGAVPKSLRYLWERHSFVTTWNGVILASPDTRVQRLTGEPTESGPYMRGDAEYRCLELGNVGSITTVALAKKTSVKSWEGADSLALIFKQEQRIGTRSEGSIDDLLMGWPVIRYIYE